MQLLAHLILLPFRVATATATMARSAMRAATAAGGVVRRAIVPTRGTATSPTIIQKSTATTAISRAALVSVVSGIIDLFGYLQSRFFFGIVLFVYLREAPIFLKNEYFRNIKA